MNLVFVSSLGVHVQSVVITSALYVQPLKGVYCCCLCFKLPPRCMYSKWVSTSKMLPWQYLTIQTNLVISETWRLGIAFNCGKYLESHLMFIAQSVSDNNIAGINDCFCWVSTSVIPWKQLCSRWGVYLPWSCNYEERELCWSSPAPAGPAGEGPSVKNEPNNDWHQVKI